MVRDRHDHPLGSPDGAMAAVNSSALRGEDNARDHLGHSGLPDR